MDNLFQNNSGEWSEHPPREMLLLFVDGELQVKDASQLEVHLEACWPCRVKTQKVQQSIAEIIEFDEQVLTPRLVPPGGWRNFDRQLNQLVAASGKQSLSSRLFSSLGRFLPVIRLAHGRRPLPTSIMRFAPILLVLVIAVGLIVYLKHEPTVSASELINNAINAQAQLIHSRNDPVFHQRLQVRRKDQGATHEESLSWEIWNDTNNSRVRHFLNDGKQFIPFIPVSAGSSDRAKQNSAEDLLTELAQVLAINHMYAQQPLSAASFQSWHNTLQRPQDEITKAKLIDGAQALTLRTVSNTAFVAGQIEEAIFVVRAKDWQPAHLSLSVKAENGKRVYELTEDFSEVVSLAQLNPSIFAPETITVRTIPKASPSPAASPAKASPNPLALTLAPLHAAATAELEVDALGLLSQVGADLGEPISVKRMADGLLHITGIVETDQRQTEIIQGLSSIASNPAVVIEIQTVAEAVAKQTSSKPKPAARVRQIEITGNTMAVEPELRAYFADKGEVTDEPIRKYSARMVSLSGGAMDHLWAMKRLLNQFSPEELRAIAPEARAKWSDLIRAHARSYQQATGALRRELQPIFFARQSVAAASDEVEVADGKELTRAVNQLFALGSANDQVVRSAFTTTTGSPIATVLRTPQFWQMTKEAESLAARIGRPVSQ
ncbi:MAG: zf-HC2 domain-containing protein [Pyrinomonadaceae bacterium]